jgi:hypothetical protein
MAELPHELVVVGRDLTAGYARLLERRRRRRRALRLVSACAAVFCVFTAAAFASGIGGDLQLDPTKWTIFDRGSVDGGRAQYVKAHSNADGRDSTFMVEHDVTLPRYDAFLLHERTVAAAGGDREAGALCTRDELTRAETVAMQALSRGAAPGANADATVGLADAAVHDAFAGTPCRGLAYAGERARFVYAGIEPRTMLMPGAR